MGEAFGFHYVRVHRLRFAQHLPEQLPRQGGGDGRCIISDFMGYVPAVGINSSAGTTWLKSPISNPSRALKRRPVRISSAALLMPMIRGRKKCAASFGNHASAVKYKTHLLNGLGSNADVHGQGHGHTYPYCVSVQAPMIGFFMLNMRSVTCPAISRNGGCLFSLWELLNPPALRSAPAQ